MKSIESQLSTSEKQTVLVAVTGGVAAYKAVEIVSALRKEGHEVHVAMTKAAQQFVSPLTFAAVAGTPVLTTPVPDQQADTLEETFPHLYPATRADVFVVVPCTANTLAKLAHGMGDDIVSCSALSLPATCARLICPAMNLEMWDQQVVQENLSILESRGWIRVGPEAGHLACGMTGPGRLARPRDILQVIRDRLTQYPPLDGKRILILSGPTREHIDPIRFLGNPSSGKMGRALAESAVAAGAEVEFVTGPVSDAELPRHPSITVHPVVSAREMLAAAEGVYASCDVSFFVAAVADYEPAIFHPDKLPKETETMKLDLLPTPDIAATLGAQKTAHQVNIGFALQTGDGMDQAKSKLQRKSLDGIVLNHPDSLGSNQGHFTWIPAEDLSHPVPWGHLDKSGCSRRLLERAADLMNRHATSTSNPSPTST